MSRTSRLLAPAVAVLATVLAVTGCGTGAAQNPSASAPASSAASGIGSNPSGVTVEGGFGETPVVTITDETAGVTELQVIDLVEGTGPAVEPGATVLADYAGYGATTKEQFDSSFDRGQPAEFGLDQVIAGWTEGIPGMKVGGRRLLVIPADLAYGANPPTEAIQPNEVLVFVVDMVNFIQPGATAPVVPVE
jgi:peptidylprolyl isomerase